MQKRWRHIAGVLAAVTALGAIPAYAQTETTESEAVESTDKNVAEPAKGSYTVSEAAPEAFLPETDTIYEEIDDAADALRSQLMMRNGVAIVNYDGEDGADMTEKLFLTALAYDATELGCGGDYLKYHYTDAKMSTYEVTEGDKVYYQYEYEVTYLSSVEQEMEVQNTVDEIMKDIDTSDDVNKISDIYHEVVTGGLSDATGDDTYNVKSAYAAMVEKSASSEGYAAALYRLLREADIDTRIVVGKVGDETQAWNMVALDGVWFYLDPYEDLGRTEWSSFLKGAEFAQKHVQTNQDDSFSGYIVSPQDYTGEIPEPSPKADEKEDEKKETQKETKMTLNDTQLWINQCYIYLLDREANAKELADQEKWFNDNEKDIQTLILKLICSDEFKTKHDVKETSMILEALYNDEVFAEKAPVDFDQGFTTFVYRAYNYYLQRQPDSEGLKYYVKALTDQHKTLEDVCAAMINSDEGKSVKMDDEAYVTALYVVILNREPDEEGMAAWLKTLKSGDRKALLHTFVYSAECKKKYPNAKFDE